VSKIAVASKFEFPLLGHLLNELGANGIALCEDSQVRTLLTLLELVSAGGENDVLLATNRLFVLGPIHSETQAVRRALSLEPRYRTFLLSLILESLNRFADDESLAKTLEQLDNLTTELLRYQKKWSGQSILSIDSKEFNEWNRMIWQSPDTVTLLAKVVENPQDFTSLQTSPVVTVGFDWLEWETPPITPAPAPWANATALHSALKTVRHPFWGAMVATLDACTGDYEWQSLILRGDLLRSFHRTLGNAQFALDSLWRSEFGLYPVGPLVVTPSLLGDHTLPLVFKTDDTESSCLPWLKIALDHLYRSEIAIESEGSWRLTDRFRTQLMKDDEHMMAFEAVRQRSYRLARSATKLSLASTNEVAAS
jgi:hypothetical protein